jgi:hypothetical protein
VNEAAKGAGAYRVLSDLTGVRATKIARKDVAAFAVGLLGEHRYLEEAVLITY